MKIPGILILALSVSSFAQTAAQNARDLKEIRDYRLNMDVITRYVDAMKKVTADPGVKKCGDISSGAGTLDAGEKNLNACAPATAILRAANLKSREFIVLTGALMGDMMAVGMKKQGAIKQYPTSLSPENAAFIEQNYAKLQAMLSGAAK